MRNIAAQNTNTNLVKKILFTLSILFICRIGSYIPVAGIDVGALKEITQQNQGGILGMFNMLSGGSLGRMSIFALAIMPYITASIIMQLLSLAYPPLEQIKKEGESGRRKITQYSRYLTLFLAAFQGYGVAVSLEKLGHTSLGPVVIMPGLYFETITVITLVVGTMLLMWLGEQISSRGIGNGASLIIFIGIVVTLPGSIISIFELTRKGALSFGVAALAPLVLISMIAIIVFFEQSYRKILVQYPKRQMGRKLYQAESTHIPIKLNTASVIPPIFASSILLFPLTIANFASNSDSSIVQFIIYNLNHGKPLFIMLYTGLIFFFSFFYTAIVFNSKETSENLKKNGAYIAGRRPGENTAEYFDYLLTRLTTIGATYLCIICVLPEIFMSKMSFSFALGGTSLLIVVNVTLDTFNQIQAHMFSGRYESLMKKMKVK